LIVRLSKIIIVLAVLGAIALYYTTQLDSHKENIEYYGGRGR
jgi:hypothetical protein